MIREIIIYPAVGIMILTMALQLTEVAESTSEKALTFTKDMENAIDCATRGVELSICSPNLYSSDFETDIEEQIDLNYQMIDELRMILENQDEEYNITNDGDSTIIIIG